MSSAIEDRFTVFIRLPFARRDFVDPPPVAWSSAKERELWEVLSKQSKSHEVDWSSLSEKFGVTQAFLLQQAAWLYERQLSQVRAQMRRMGSRASNVASPVPTSGVASQSGGYPMRRGGSGGPRAPTRLSTQPSTAAVQDGSTPNTPTRARSSLQQRAVSVTTEPQGSIRGGPVSSRPLSRRSSKDNDVASRTQSRRGSLQNQTPRSPGQVAVPEADSSEDDDMTQSRLMHRRPNPATARKAALSRKTGHPRRSSNTTPQLAEAAEDDDEDSPAFLPFPSSTGRQPRESFGPVQDPSATIRGGLTQGVRPATYRRTTSERIVATTDSEKDAGPEQMASSTSSNSVSDNSKPRGGQKMQREARQQGRGDLPSPLSPRQQAALAAAAGLSPRLRRSHPSGQNGSDTSPSMGSSFSDLDDASVTQSALEEALLSGMGNTTMTVAGNTLGNTAVGNVANRVSGISQALRSRYFDSRSDSQR